MNATFSAAFPVQGVAVRHWLLARDGPIAGLMFFSAAHHTSGIKRVRVTTAARTHESRRSRPQMHTGRANEKKRLDNAGERDI
jgi:hypothetical protein